MRETHHLRMLWGAGIALLMAGALAGCGPEPPSTSPPAVGSASIVCTLEGLAIDGHAIPRPLVKSHLAKRFGPYSRRFYKANTIDVWDDLGLFAYAYPEPETDSYFSLAVAFGEEKRDMAYYPRSNFQGRVVVNGQEIAPDTSPETLSAAGYVRDETDAIIYKRKTGSILVIVVVNKQSVVTKVEFSLEKVRLTQEWEGKFGV